ncbi:hypothetical protein [Streptomyces sp. NPDC004267]|uniref:hypothetical protein n=1 Tax=Streptomyces sp. NPDC004267 TaxID=3364694 RepID=UPI00369A56CD
MRAWVGFAVKAAVAGAGFGAVTSLLNALGSPYGSFGAGLRGTFWARCAQVLSLLVDTGWAWAALAVVAGLAAGALRRGAVAGVAALGAACAAYYVTDGVVRDEPFGTYGGELLFWWAGSVLAGSVLGAVGAAARRPGAAGLLAGLVVPAGAAVQMAVLPPGTTTEAWAGTLARGITWAGAAALALWLVVRFVRQPRPAAVSARPGA